MQAVSANPPQALPDARGAQNAGPPQTPPGQAAKEAVAAARAEGVDLPKNAQGVAASAIAQGAPAETVFAALVVPEPDDTPPADDAPVGDDAVPVTDAPEVAAPAAADDGATIAPVAPTEVEAAPEKTALAQAPEATQVQSTPPDPSAGTAAAGYSAAAELIGAGALDTAA